MKIEFTIPSNGEVEYKRAFLVEGKIIDGETNDNYVLHVDLLDKDGSVVRHVCCDKINKDTFVYHPLVVTYDDKLDPNREKFSSFGFPELVVDDINHPYDSLYKACNKCWFSNNEFKAFIVSASNTIEGSLFSDGMNYCDENGNPYSLLQMGDYKTHVYFLDENNKIVVEAYKEIKIIKRDNQLICRFNPLKHKQRMIDWCKQNNFSIIKDRLPGYLDPYLGTWYYHMGLLKMYRANDICLFEDVNINMFVYLIDETSTSYSTELAYLQNNGVIGMKDRCNFYYYDIGEAYIGKNKPYYKEGTIKKFEENEVVKLCRVDVLKGENDDNIYYLDERNVVDVKYDFSDLTINSDCEFAIMGVVKPTQMDKNDFSLNYDNTYRIKNYPKTVKYTFNEYYSIEKDLNMERIEDISIGTSVFEFYNILEIDNQYKNETLNINVEVIDAKGNVLGSESFEVKVD